MMVSQDLIVSCIWLIVNLNSGNAQNNDQYPFVPQFFDPINIDKTSMKLYKTTLFINSSTAVINKTIIQQSGISLYNGSDPSLQGFRSLLSSSEMMPQQAINTSIFKVTYDVTYGYLSLNTSTRSSDLIILSTIGNVSFVKNHLENEPDFILYNVLTEKFNFTGLPVCQATINCQFGAECSENVNGTNVACISRCFQNYCLNGGWCIQPNASVEPVCSCPCGLDFWYVGNHCETLLQLWMLILFFVLVGIVLFLLIPMLTWWCTRGIVKRLSKEKLKEKMKILKKTQPKSSSNDILSNNMHISKAKEVSQNNNQQQQTLPISPSSRLSSVNRLQQEGQHVYSHRGFEPTSSSSENEESIIPKVPISNQTNNSKSPEIVEPIAKTRSNESSSSNLKDESSTTSSKNYLVNPSNEYPMTPRSRSFTTSTEKLSRGPMVTTV